MAHLGATQLNDFLRPRRTQKPGPLGLDLSFSAVFSLVMITALHGLSALKILLILWVNYAIGKRFGRTAIGVYATWIFNLAVLFGNEIYDGYSFGDIHVLLSPLVGSSVRI